MRILTKLVFPIAALALFSLYQHLLNPAVSKAKSKQTASTAPATNQNSTAAAAATRRIDGTMNASTEELIVSNDSSFSENNTNQTVPQRAVRLEFVHIPKTGGSAVEKAAWEQAGVKWGHFHFLDKKHKQKTQSFMSIHGGFPPWHAPPCLLTNFQDANNENATDIGKRKYDGNNDNMTNSVPWNPYHNYSKLQILKAMRSRANGGIMEEEEIISAGTDGTETHLFAIVRNPYERAVSEYRYKVMFMGGKPGSPVGMNNFIALQLKQVEKAQEKLFGFLESQTVGVDQERAGEELNVARAKNSTKNTTSLARKTPDPEEHMLNEDQWLFDSCRHVLWDSRGKKEYLTGSGHWIPQYDYVYHQFSNGAESGRRKMIHHVLKYGSSSSKGGNKTLTLSEQFHNLMKLYGLDQKIKLPEHHHNKKSNGQKQQIDNQKEQQQARIYVNKNAIEEKVSPDFISSENIRKINMLFKDDFEAFGFPMRHS